MTMSKETVVKNIEAGEYQAFASYARKLDDREKLEEFANLKESLKKNGQLYPILVTIVEADEIPVKVIKGNTRLKAIEELKKSDEWCKEIDVKLVDPKNAAKEVFASASFCVKDYSKFQRALFGVKFFHKDIAAQAKLNQKTSSANGKSINTDEEVAKICNTNSKYVQIAKKALEIDEWFYNYIYTENNNIPYSDIQELTKLPTDVNGKTLEHMKHQCGAIACKNLYKAALEAAVKEKAELDDHATQKLIGNSDDNGVHEKQALSSIGAAVGNRKYSKDELKKELKNDKKLYDNTHADQQAENSFVQPSTEGTSNTGNVTSFPQVDDHKRVILTFNVAEDFKSKLITMFQEAGHGDVEVVDNHNYREAA